MIKKLIMSKVYLLYLLYLAMIMYSNVINQVRNFGDIGLSSCQNVSMTIIYNYMVLESNSKKVKLFKIRDILISLAYTNR